MRPASLLLALVLGAGSVNAVAARPPDEIKIATWNLEWFMKAGNDARAEARLHAARCAA